MKQQTISTAGRIVVFHADDGWRWRVQSTNWRVMDRAGHGVKTSRQAKRTASRRYPGVEVVIVRD